VSTLFTWRLGGGWRKKKSIVWFFIHLSYLFTTRGGTRRIHNFWEKFWGPVLNCFLLFKWISHSWISEEYICKLGTSTVRGMDDTIPPRTTEVPRDFYRNYGRVLFYNKWKVNFHRGPHLRPVPYLTWRSGDSTQPQVRSGLRSGVPEKIQVRSGLRSGGPRDLDLRPETWTWYLRPDRSILDLLFFFDTTSDNGGRTGGFFIRWRTTHYWGWGHGGLTNGYPRAEDVLYI
jgi:hypothetical protein